MKQYPNLFPKDFIEEAVKDAPGGVHIVLKGNTRDEVNVIAIGYCYSHKTILHFVLTENAGNTEPGDPYKMKYADSYGTSALLLLIVQMSYPSSLHHLM